MGHLGSLLHAEIARTDRDWLTAPPPRSYWPLGQMNTTRSANVDLGAGGLGQSIGAAARAGSIPGIPVANTHVSADDEDASRRRED
jgi:hypothetical protein